MNENSKEKLKQRNIDESDYRVDTAFRYIKRHYSTYNTPYHYYKTFISEKIGSQPYPEKLLLLDAGCGWRNLIVGKHLSNNIHNNILAIGIDLNADSLKKNITYENLILCNLEYLPFKDKIFDIITNMYVLEHLEKPERVFEEFQRTMKSKGSLIILFPNLINPLNLFGVITPTILHKKFISRLLEKNEKDIFQTYFRCNTDNSLEKFARRSGFKRKSLVRSGNFAMFLFSRFLIYCWIIFEKSTNMVFLNRFKMIIVAEYEKDDNLKGLCKVE